MLSIRLLALAAVLATMSARAADAGPQLYQHGQIRISYRTTGDDAVQPEDRNQNHIPDQVEDAATQIEAAHLLYCGILGYPDPFQSKRYDGVAFLEVGFRKKETLKGNGKAYDEPQKSTRPGDPPGTRIVRVGIATSVSPTTNPTPGHEFFHVIQNGATYFKNRWFTEGTARWAQRPFGPDGAPASHVVPWPLNPEQTAALVDSTYDTAASFWKPLAVRYDGAGEVPKSALTEQLAAMTYVNGDKVWKTQTLPGWKLTRALLMQLHAASEKAAQDRNLKTWPEAEQGSPENNRYLIEAVGKAIGELSGPASEKR